MSGTASRALAILEQVEDGIFVKDEGGRYELMNPAGARMLGVDSPADIVGKTDDDLFGAEAAAEMRRIDRTVLRTGQAHTYQRCRAVGGRQRVFFTTKVRYQEAGEAGPRLVGIVRDITERHELESQLADAERRATVGGLQGSVAHELNNPLAMAMGNLETAIEEVRDGAPVSGRVLEGLATARAALERVAQIARGLAQSAAPASETRSAIDLHALLDSAAELAHGELRYRARLERTYGAPLEVDGSRQELFQVFLGLLVAAARGLPEGEASSHAIHVQTARRGGSALVEVRSPTGRGLAEAGPGAAAIETATYLTSRHGGSLALGHPVEGGSSVVVELPSRGTAPRQARPTLTRTLRAPERPKTILLVDDEPQIRRLLRRALGRQNQYLEAGSGAEAIRVLCEEAPDVDVVLCDLMMPEVTGPELYRWMCQHRPDIAAKTGFITGGAFTDLGRAFLESTDRPVLEKPFTREQLQDFVASILGDRDETA